MKKIPLTQGKFALVDDENYAFLMQWKWRFSLYAVRTEWVGSGRDTRKAKHHWMHRIINKTPDGMITDHINGDKLDNRKLNLRSATVSQNGMNQKKTRGSSLYKGVFFHKKSNKYRAYINVNGSREYLGIFQEEKLAAAAYDAAALKKFGEFAKLNMGQK